MHTKTVNRLIKTLPWVLAAGVTAFTGAAAASADECPNASLRTAASANLPDCRGYEMVTPVAKGDTEVSSGGFHGGGKVQSTPAGDAVTFVTVAPMPGSASGGLGNQYLARRTAAGWDVQPISPPEDVGPSNTSSFDWFSSDLSSAVVRTLQGPALAPGAQPDVTNLYLRDNATGAYRLLTVVPPPNPPDPNGGYTVHFAGASSDFRHILVEAYDQLTPDSPGGYTPNLYELVEGHLRYVGILPGGTPSTEPTDALESLVANYDHAISEDGSKIFFTAGPLRAETGRLYVRIDGATTVQVNASQKTNGSGPGGTDASGPQPARYEGATADGSQAFFTTTEQLTNDATASAASYTHDLYRYDVSSGALEDLTPDAADPGGADVMQVLGIAQDGAYVYFAARGALAPGATAGAANLYVLHGGTTTYIGALDQWADYFLLWTNPSLRMARMTPDGRYFAFASVARLTSYDNRDAVTGQPDAEVYLYDAGTGHLVCASCNPSGARPLGAASVDPTIGQYGVQSRNLSEDGSRLFFDTRDALVPGDTNGVADVYEYSHGQVALISTGRGSTESYFAEASAEGADVFFATRQQLVAADQDEKIDLYDARVNGGFPDAPRPLAPCESGCRAAAALTAPFSAPSEGAAFEGSAQRGAKLSVARPVAGALRALLRTGTLTVHATVEGGGVLSAALLRGGHALARAQVTVEQAGGTRVSVRLRLSVRQRRALARARRTTVVLVVALPGAATRRIPLTLSGVRG